MVQGIKALKLYAWEAPFTERVEALRAKELFYVWASAMLQVGFMRPSPPARSYTQHANFTSAGLTLFILITCLAVHLVTIMTVIGMRCSFKACHAADLQSLLL